MKKRKARRRVHFTKSIFGLVMGGVFAGLFLQASAFAQCGDACSSGDYIQTATADGIVFAYKVHDGVMDIKITCDTTGWVSVGFNPTKQMKDANFIIAYVDMDQKIFARDDFGIDETHHKADVDLGGKSDFSKVFGSEANGVTMVGFTIPLNSKDQFDGTVLVAGKEQMVILGCGKDGFDNFTSIHKKVGTMTIKF